MPPPLPRSFYQRDALRLARELLGKVLVHRTPDGPLVGRIVEVEAYRGPEDQAAHTANGRRTPRNEVMWGEAGHLYVYFVYGMHFCANVVAGGPGVPEAVLLRGLEPLEGLAAMRARRGPAGKDDALLRGPAVLCRSLGIDRALNGADLTQGPVVILDAPRVPARSIVRTPRIGVDYAGEHAARPWRFCVAGSKGVTR